jgi:hypothetical protein
MHNQGTVEDMDADPGVRTAVGWLGTTLGARHAAQWRSIDNGPWTAQLLIEPLGYSEGAADSVVMSSDSERTVTVGSVEDGGSEIDAAMWVRDGAGTITPLDLSSLTDHPVELSSSPPRVALAPDDSIFIVASGTIAADSALGGDPNVIAFQMLPPPPPCVADINDDDVVDVEDMLLVLTDWGAGGLNPSDVNLDMQVNISDLLAVIVMWGPCAAGGRE